MKILPILPLFFLAAGHTLANVVIESSPGFQVLWDGNDGDYFDVVPPPDGALVPDNLALASQGAVSFASGELGLELGLPFHLASNANDGHYGNANSWIGGSGDSLPFVGIDLGGTFEVSYIAWSRDNGNGAIDRTDPGSDACDGQCNDRSLGIYQLQITTVANPDSGTSEGDWVTVGTLDYQENEDDVLGGGFSSYLRHQYLVAMDDGSPISATGVRLIVPEAGGTAIDEIEIYDASFTQRLRPSEEGGEFAAEEVNLAESGTAFAKDVIADGALEPHQTSHLNDGIYGNSNSWIGNSEGSFAGISLGGTPVVVGSIAFGRDNLSEFTDRVLGVYALQYTTTPDPDEATAEGDWTTIGEIIYEAGSPVFPALRHRINFAAVQATGIRLIAPGGAAIDEIELYESPILVTPPPPQSLVIEASSGFTVTWDGNDGDHFDVVPPTEGAIVPENLALASQGAESFASGELGPELGLAFHVAFNANDGHYGNANSWISGSGDSLPFIGVNLGGTFDITSVAWGRDNGNGAIDLSEAGSDACGGQCNDRALGIYELQVTTVANPGVDTADEDWVTVGIFDYRMTDDDLVGGGFTSYLRHEFEIGTEDGNPVSATGVRIIVPEAGGTAIDEIEIYDASIIPRLRPSQEGGEFAADETNLSEGGTPFAKDVIADGALAPHQTSHLNDGIYGNSNSWIGNSEGSFAGISLGTTPVVVSSIAFGRDNLGEFNDRSLGLYILQYTTTANPDQATPEGDWLTIGEIVYEAGSPTFPALRHRINFAAVEATGIRLVAPGGAAIDEIELYADPITVIPPPPEPLVIEPAEGFLITWDGNDGDHFDPTAPEEGGALVPDNLALASNGVTPFGSGELGPELTLDFHLISNVNDGVYGNSRSWIGGSTDSPSFIGLNFGRSVLLGAVAWGRDNGNGEWDDSQAGTDACGGQCDDRNGGVYTVQITTVSDPNGDTPEESWVTVGTLNYRFNDDEEPGSGFTRHLRHEYAITTAEGLPLEATGIRLLVPNASIAIDELEIYGPKGDPLLAVENGGIEEVLVGTTMQTFHLGVTNEGATQALNLSEVTLEGSNAANFTLISFPSTLEPGASEEFVIEFDPAGSVGRFLAQIRVASNDEFSPDLTIPILVSVENSNRLVAHYKMDAIEGDELVDSSGNQYHGVFRTTGDGAVSLEAEGLASGSAVRFSGEVAFAEIPAEAGLPNLETFSISMWVRYDAEDANTASTLFSKGASTGDPFSLVATVGDTPSPLQFFSGGESDDTSDPAVQTLTPHHVVAVHVDENGSAVAGATSFRIYVDGVMVLENLSPAGFDDRSPSIFQIGATNGGFGMLGVVDDVQIYQKEITETERLFLSENPGLPLPGDDVPPPPAGFAAEGVRFVEGGVEIAWSSEAGMTYIIEVSETMRSDDWEPLPGATEVGAGEGARTTFVDEGADGSLQRFYRIGIVSE